MIDPLVGFAQFLFVSRKRGVLVAWLKKFEIPHEVVISLESCRNCGGRKIISRQDGERECKECNKDGLRSSEAVQLKIGDEVWLVRFHKSGTYRDMVWT